MSFCPATMCPLFAANGSPWTGDKDSPCERDKCGWWHKGQCNGSSVSLEQIYEVAESGTLLQIGIKRAKRTSKGTPKHYECQRASECQWQIEAGSGLCPPRLAMSLGIDPATCAY